MPSDPSAQSCSAWRFSEAVTDKKKKKNGFAHQPWFFSLHKIAFAFLNQTVGRSGLNLASRVTVGRCFTWFSRRPLIFSFKHPSYNFSIVFRHFSGFGDWYSQPTVCRTSAGKATVSILCYPRMKDSQLLLGRWSGDHRQTSKSWCRRPTTF